MTAGVARAPRMEGKVVIITGGAKGIGRGASQVFADEGATVVVADKNAAAGEAAAAELVTIGHTAVFVETDVTAKASCVGLVASVLERFGRIDVLLSNAGIYPLVSLQEMTEDSWEHIFAVNVKGMFFMVQAVVPVMRACHYGRIVLTSSVVGPVTGTRGGAHYGATKAAMLGFMRSAALEVAQDGVTVNAVMPGYILTEGARAAQSQEDMNSVSAVIPMKRQGDPKDIGYAMLFLASDEASYITGQTIIVDGGLTLPT